MAQLKKKISPQHYEKTEQPTFASQEVISLKLDIVPQKCSEKSTRTKNTKCDK